MPAVGSHPEDYGKTEEAIAARDLALASSAFANRRLELVLEQAPAAICTTKGPDHVIVSTNGRYREMAGNRDLDGLTVRAAFGAGASVLIDVLDRVYSTGQPCEGREVPLSVERTGTGEASEAFFNFIYQPLMPEGGTVEGIMIFAVDVTDQVHARHRVEDLARERIAILGQIQAGQRRYSEQLRMLADAATAANAKLSVDAVTQAIADRAREIIGARIAIVTMGGDRLTRAVSSLPGRPGDPPDGVAPDPGAEEGIRAELTDRGAVSIGTVQVCSKLEGEFSETDQSILVQLAQVGSVAIGNAVLYEAEHAATRVRDDVMAIVSHDLRNPLTTISMSASLLLGPLSDGNADRIAVALRIQRSAARMNRLISDLIDVTRIEASLLAVAPSPNAAGTLLEEAIDPFRPIAAEKGMTLTKELAPDLPMVLADKERVLQLLGNLIGNAIKFTPAQGQVTFRAERDDDAVRFTVKNTGPVIAPEHISQVFDRYWRANEKARLGIGLGLFIAKKIVEGHGGRIWVESNTADGTAFSFTLPTCRTT